MRACSASEHAWLWKSILVDALEMIEDFHEELNTKNIFLLCGRKTQNSRVYCCFIFRGFKVILKPRLTWNTLWTRLPSHFGQSSCL